MYIKSYADLLLICCSCAPCIQFVQKSSYFFLILRSKDQNLGDFGDIKTY